MKKFFFIFFLLTSCVYQNQMLQVRQDFNKKDVQKLEKHDSTLSLLITAQACFFNNEFEKSDSLFEKFNKQNINPIGFNFLKETQNLVLGNNFSDYKPYMMDFLFVYYYQLLDNFFLQNKNNIRVIINQSYYRQQQLSKIYKDLINKKQNKKLTQEINTINSEWKAFDDIMHPALTYLSGLYYLNNGEFENARQYLKRTSGMMPDNTFIVEDLLLAEKKQKPKNISYVFIEDGFLPLLKDTTIRLPYFINGQYQILSIPSNTPILDKSKHSIKESQLLLDVDKMFLTEYKEYQINNIIRSITKVIYNYNIQKSINNNPAIALLGNIYTLATTQSDLRTWTTLPKSIYILRIKTNDLKKILPNDNMMINGNYLIYIRNHDIKKVRL